jgi:sugar-phosphatase
VSFVAEESHGAERVAIVVAGVAGTGKTTLGRALAGALGLPLLDLDSVTVPLLDRLGAHLPSGHWMTAPAEIGIRAGRYAALREVARDVLSTGPGAVLVAPFTAELRGGPEWRELAGALSPAVLHVVYLSGPADLVRSRRALRGAARDRHRPDDAFVEPPAVDVLLLDAALPTERQLDHVLGALSG